MLHRICIGVICFFLLFCMCVDPVNPFFNIQEAQAVIFEKNFLEGDSVNIFSTKSLSIVVNLREHVESYTVQIESNRLWRSTDSTITQSKISANLQEFAFSFSDTGSKKIVITTNRKNGERIIEHLTLFVKSPLSQAQIIAKPGDEIFLSTQPVADSVSYVWNLKNGEVISDKKTTVFHTVKNTFIGAQGELYVTDGVTKSPSVNFSIVDPETPPLVVTYLTDSLFNDTIVSTTKQYELKVLLEGASSLKLATVNGVGFNAQGNDVGKILLTSKQFSLDTSATARQLNLTIQDGYGRVFLDTLYVRYQPGALITVLEPIDSTVVRDSILHIYGIVRGGGVDSLSMVFATVNGISNPLISRLNSNVWSLSLLLTPGWNSIKIEVYKDSLRTRVAIASKIHRVYYLPTILFACVNDSVSGDTVFTGNRYLDFAVLVTVSFPIKSAKVNSVLFDNTNSQGTNSYKFTKYLRDLDTSKIMSVKIEITSQADQVYEHMFYIKYVEGIIVSKPFLTLVSPSADSTITSDSTYHVRGIVERYLQYGEVFLFVSVNGVVIPGYSHVRQDSTWDFIVPLNDGWNEISIDVFEDSTRNGTSISKTLTYLKYASGSVDQTAPHFVSIRTAGGIEIIDGLVFDTTTIDVIITVTDNIKPVNVIVNDTIIAKTADNFDFTCSIPLQHFKDKPVTICAYDEAGNNICTYRSIAYNTKPKFSTLPESKTIFIDSTYTFFVGVADSDEDTLDLTVKVDALGGDTELSVNNLGYFTWTPAQSDTGRRIFTFIVWDGYERVEDQVSMIAVVSKTQHVPVKWLTTQGSRTQLQADLDTLKMQLVVDTLTGSQPFSVKALLDGKSLLLTSENETTFNLQWVPKPEHIGFWTIQAIVGDSLNYTDTLLIMVQVVPAPLITINWKPTTASYSEVSGNQSIIANLSKPAPITITIPCVIDWSKSTATPIDVTIPDTSYLVFNPGDSVAMINVHIEYDAAAEYDETFSMRMVSMPDYMRLQSGDTFTGTIIDDDKVSFAFERSSASGNEKSTNRSGMILLSRTVSTETIIEVAVDSASTATTNDFSILSSKITIPANNSSAELFFNIMDDKIYENIETIIINIFSPSINTVPGVITTYTYSIENDDIQKSDVYFSGQSTYQFFEDNPTGITLKLSLSSELGVPLTVRYGITSSSTAKLLSDFTVTPSDSVTFEPGIKEKSITIVPVDDRRREFIEFGQITILSISDKKAGRIGIPATSTFTIYDDD